MDTAHAAATKAWTKGISWVTSIRKFVVYLLPVQRCSTECCGWVISDNSGLSILLFPCSCHAWPGIWTISIFDFSWEKALMMMMSIFDFQFFLNEGTCYHMRGKKENKNSLINSWNGISQLRIKKKCDFSLYQFFFFILNGFTGQ